MEYYWEIVKRDGSVVEVTPAAVETIRRRWDEGKAIHTRYETIPAHQIVDFRQTAKPYGTPLLEAVAQAFNEPQFTPDGSVVARWVKKHVTTRDWAKHYSLSPGYKKLADEAGMVVVAFRLAVHDIDTAKVSYCSNDEVESLER